MIRPQVNALEQRRHGGTFVKFYFYFFGVGGDGGVIILHLLLSNLMCLFCFLTVDVMLRSIRLTSPTPVKGGVMEGGWVL